MAVNFAKMPLFCKNCVLSTTTLRLSILLQNSSLLVTATNLTYLVLATHKKMYNATVKAVANFFFCKLIFSLQLLFLITRFVTIANSAKILRKNHNNGKLIDVTKMKTYEIGFM